MGLSSFANPFRNRWAAVVHAGVLTAATVAPATGLPASLTGQLSGALHRHDCPRLARSDFDYTLSSADESVVRPTVYTDRPTLWNVWSPGDTSTPLTRAVVSLKDGIDVPDGCSYRFVLASYATAGPTWPTSGGAQHFLGAERGRVSAEHPVVVLDVPAPTGYGQVDLYTGRVVYDGKPGRWHGPLPDHDGGVHTPGRRVLVSAWNGGAPPA